MNILMIKVLTLLCLNLFNITRCDSLSSLASEAPLLMDRLKKTPLLPHLSSQTQWPESTTCLKVGVRSSQLPDLGDPDPGTFLSQGISEFIFSAQVILRFHFPGESKLPWFL